ncbi:hypothetical protein [Streptomyces sp. SID1121]|uniref:hypothetical protein n=1 Tax=Streptomyces sp. SID1121 TaxID=3425888 RepID=UPI0040564E88
MVIWGKFLDTCGSQLKKQQERLNYASNQARSAEYAARAHADASVLHLLTSHNDIVCPSAAVALVHRPQDNPLDTRTKTALVAGELPPSTLRSCTRRSQDPDG